MQNRFYAKVEHIKIIEKKIYDNLHKDLLNLAKQVQDELNVKKLNKNSFIMNLSDAISQNSLSPSDYLFDKVVEEFITKLKHTNNPKDFIHDTLQKGWFYVTHYGSMYSYKVKILEPLLSKLRSYFNE